MIPPSHRPIRIVAESNVRVGIRYHVWLAIDHTRIVVESAGTWIGTVQDFLGGRALRDPLFQPQAVVQRLVNGVQVRAAIDTDSLIQLHTELHLDALE